MRTVSDIISLLKAKFGCNKDAELCRTLDLHVQHIYNWRQRGSIPLSVLCEIALKHRISLDYLIMGDPDVSERQKECEEFQMVPKYNARVSCGGGSFVDLGSDQVVDHLAFKKDWLMHRAGSLTGLLLLTAQDDSMEPTIRHGDMLLVNGNQTNIGSRDGIYVILRDDMLYAKRLLLGYDKSITIKSDNELYGSHVVTGPALMQLRVIGKVIWFGRDLV
jgi:phage repressor protein C with HTH and peptisase S24 domain